MKTFACQAKYKHNNILLEISHTVNIQNFDNRNRGDLSYKNIFSSPG